jgi:UPF0271 protein
VLHDADAAVAQGVRLARERRVTTIDGAELAIEADSICLHGDKPGAVERARSLRAALERAGVEVRPFAQ